MTTKPGPSSAMKKRGKLCAVAFCRNYETEGVGFFRFPRERDLRQLWVERCGRKDPINIPNARVCSAHFEKNDFVPDLRAKLMGTKPLRRLVKGAVPSLNLGLTTGTSKSDDSTNLSKCVENLVECIIIESLPLEPESKESKYRLKYTVKPSNGSEVCLTNSLGSTTAYAHSFDVSHPKTNPTMVE